MDCAAFFEAAETALADDASEPTRTTTADQCVYDFYHPRAVETFGTDGLVTRFNRSGVVWAPPARRLAVQLRVPAPHGDAVRAALADSPHAFERTDHRGVATPDGEMVTVLHFTVKATDVTDADLTGTLDAVATALSV